MSGVPGTGILRPSVSQAEEGWLHEAGLQPETVEQVPEVSTLQNGKHGNGHHLDPEEGLVHQDRPQRCVLDGTGMSGRQEVPSICMERASVAVSSPGVWTGFGAPVFHQTDDTGGGIIKEDWHEVEVFLDDALAMNQTREMGLRDRDSVLFLLQKLGFIINWKKSELQPEQIMEFLGFSVNSMDMTLSLPRNKILDIRSRCQDMIPCSSVSVRQLAKLIGKLTATALAIIPGPLYCRQLQMLKTKALLKGQQNYEAILTLTAECKTELAWWVESLETYNGRSFIAPNPDMTITSDASKAGWGAVTENNSTQGVWSQEESSCHINRLELRAAGLGLRAFTKNKTQMQVHLRLDNRTAVAYLNKQGGTRSLPLLQETKDVWEYCMQQKITITAEYLPGKLNCQADRESRVYQDSSNWQLDTAIFAQLQSQWGTMTMDL